MFYEVCVTGADNAARTYRIQVLPNAENGRILVRIGEKEMELDVTITERGVLSLLVGQKSFAIRREGPHVTVGSETFAVEVRDPRSLRSRRATGASAEGPKRITASMPGKVVRILMPEGSSVEAEQGVIVIEAMKMQNEMKAPKAGIVTRIAAAEGATVNAGDTLAIIE
jgi:biotin carboxyl carrier protein